MEDVRDEIDELTDLLPREELAPELELRGLAMAPGEPGRAEFLSSASEWFGITGDPRAALRLARLAADDGGRATIEPRATLLNALLKAGQREEAATLGAELIRDYRAGRLDPWTPEIVGESLEVDEQWHLALRWFNLGLRDLDPDEIESDDYLAIGCVHGHYRVRRQLGLAMDRFDHASDRIRHRAQQERQSTPRTTAGIRPFLLHWPAAEFLLLTERWPELAEGYGATAEGHRAATEEHLREYALQGLRLPVVMGTVDGLTSYAAAGSLDLLDSGTRAAYAAELGRLGQSVAWPPGRNEPCWCGSGTKYKRCCGQA